MRWARRPEVAAQMPRLRPPIPPSLSSIFSVESQALRPLRFSLSTYLSCPDFGNGGIPDFNGDSNCGQSGHPLCQYYLIQGPNALYNPQYTSLNTLRSIGFSNYNALQATLRHQMSHGGQFDFNYTYSKSIDLCSDAERLGNYGALNFNGGCQMFNAWSPNLFRAVSDFDTTHQLNANWIVDLPFGRGRAIAGHVNSGLDAAIGAGSFPGYSAGPAASPTPFTTTQPTTQLIGTGKVPQCPPFRT